MLLDLKMKNGDGIKVIDFVTKKYPDIRIIVLSSYYRDSFLGTDAKEREFTLLFQKKQIKENLSKLFMKYIKKDIFLQSDKYRHSESKFLVIHLN